jgi:antitoxin component YwqK of YwqJK toxin-antitoxin module
MVNGVKQGVAKYYSETGYLMKEVPFDKGVENGNGRSYDETGNVINLSIYKNGYLVKDEKINRKDKFSFKQGTWKEFYPDFVVKKEANYKDDKLEGPVKYYNPEGQFTKMDIFKDGELVIDKTANVKLEIDRDYHAGGRVKSSVNIIDGKKQGVYREYDIKGNITSSKLYRDNEIYAEGLVDENMKYQGPWKFYYKSGKLRSEGSFKDGNRDGEWKFYYENGKLEQSGKYVSNLPDGEWKWYFMNGKLLREESYLKGKEEGYMKEFSDTATVIAEGNYIEGRRDGAWKFFSEAYTAQGSYIDGLETGNWKGYFSNGKLAFEGSYFEGNENGEHRYYYDNGKVKQIRNYKSGLADGVWKSYDITGELILTTTYIAGEEVKFD